MVDQGSTVDNNQLSFNWHDSSTKLRLVSFVVDPLVVFKGGKNEVVDMYQPNYFLLIDSTAIC